MFLLGLWSFACPGRFSGCVRFEAQWSRWRLHCTVSPACLCWVHYSFSYSQNKKTPSPVLLAGSVVKFIVRYFACISGQGLGCPHLRNWNLGSWCFSLHHCLSVVLAQEPVGTHPRRFRTGKYFLRARLWAVGPEQVTRASSLHSKYGCDLNYI